MICLFADITTSGTLQSVVLNNARKLPFSLFSVNKNSALWEDSRGPVTESRCGRHLLSVFLNAVVKSRGEIQQLVQKMDKELQIEIGDHVQALYFDMSTFEDLLL